MKLFKKVLGLILILLGILGVVWGFGEIGGWQDKRGQEGQEITQEPIKFAVMSDIHSDWENFRKALEKAKEGFGPAFAEASASGSTKSAFGQTKSARQGFVIVTGDLTTLGKKSEFLEAKKILDESGLKYFVIPGNHDIWWGRKYKQDVWGEVFGESFLSFTTSSGLAGLRGAGKDKEIKFILVNNADGEGGFEGFEGFGQKGWLEEEIKECLRIYCLVFMHMPLNHPSSTHVMGEGSPSVANEARELAKLFIENNVKDIFAGHLHFSSDYEIEGLKTNIVGAIASDRNFQSPKFNEVEIKNKEVTYKEVFLAD